MRELISSCVSGERAPFLAARAAAPMGVTLAALPSCRFCASDAPQPMPCSSLCRSHSQVGGDCCRRARSVSAVSLDQKGSTAMCIFGRSMQEATPKARRRFSSSCVDGGAGAKEERAHLRINTSRRRTGIASLARQQAGSPCTGVQQWMLMQRLMRLKHGIKLKIQELCVMMILDEGGGHRPGSAHQFHEGWVTGKPYMVSA
jgi:hypothetical protein